MSKSNKFAKFIFNIATGNKKRRILGTPLGLIIFSIIILSFILVALWLDNWLSLPDITSWYTYVLAAFLFIPGLSLVSWVFVLFLKARGTPVPVNPPTRLVISGPFAYVRNPMAIGAFLMLEGLGFYFGSLLLLLIFAPLPVILYGLFIKFVEEPELEMRFGQEYVEYQQKVPMFIPNFRK